MLKEWVGQSPCRVSFFSTQCLIFLLRLSCLRSLAPDGEGVVELAESAQTYESVTAALVAAESLLKCRDNRHR